MREWRLFATLPHMKMLAAIQVLHTRSCSGMGTYFMRFLAACYLCFNMDYNTVLMALASLPPIMPARRMPSGERPQLKLPQVKGPSSMQQAGGMHIRARMLWARSGLCTTG